MTVAEAPTTLVRRLTVAAVVLNVLLVVTGGAVRLTGSGLGCPTWPRCTEESLTTTPELGIHGLIEFGNRLLGVGLELVGIALLIAVLGCGRSAPRAWRWLAGVQVLVVPAQAVVGGVLVLTGLNPWVRTLHFLVSFPIMLAALALLRRVTDGAGTRAAAGRPELRWLTTGLLAVTSAVVVVGALVTGTGPHAGDPGAARLSLDPETVTQVHADLAFLLIGLTVATVVACRALGAPAAVRRSVGALLALLAAQGLLGYVSYATGVPPLLVGLHMLGASLVFLAAAWAHLSTTRPAQLTGDHRQPDLVPSVGRADRG